MFKFLATGMDRYVIWLAARALRGAKDLPPNREKAQALLDSDSYFLRPPAPEITWKNDTDFEFDSLVATEFPLMDRVWGKFIRAGKDWRKKPSVVMVHGWNDEFGYTMRFPWLAKKFQSHGINSMFIELPFHLHRRPKGEGIPRDFVSSDLHSTARAAKQSLADIRATIAWLEQETSGKIALWGLSLGALLGGILLQIEERIKSGILMIPVYDLERAFCELDFCEPIHRSMQKGKLNMEKISLLHQKPLIPPEDILIIESQYDLFAPKDTVEQLWQSWDQPNIWRLKHGHISVILSAKILTLAVDWLAEKQRDS